MLDALLQDAARYSEMGGWWSNLGFWVGAVYRLGSWARTLPALLRYPLLFLYWLAKQPGRFLLHVEIPAGARIGPGLFLIHPFNIFVPREAIIGADCTIFHEVTIGNGPLPGVPRLGDHVVLFVGSRVLGGITLGNRCEVGANCVLTRSVPEGMLVVPSASQFVHSSLVRGRKAQPEAPAKPAEGTEKPAETPAKPAGVR